MEARGMNRAFSTNGGMSWTYGWTNVPTALWKTCWSARFHESSSDYFIPFNAHSRDMTAMRFEGIREVAVYSNVTFAAPAFQKGNYVGLGWDGVVMPDGRYLVTGHSRLKGEDKRKLSLLCYVSSDQGRSFQYLSTIAHPRDIPWRRDWPAGFEGANESSMVLLPDGDLLVVARVGQKKANPFVSQTGSMQMMQARSRDGGLTWNITPLNIEGTSPKLLLMSNGILVLAFGRLGNNLLFSTDGGRNWGHEVRLTSADTRTSGYVDIVELEPGRLFVVYDMYNTDPSGIWLWEPEEVNGVFGVFLTVKRMIGGT